MDAPDKLTLFLGLSALLGLKQRPLLVGEHLVGKVNKIYIKK